ncbi:MAG: cupin domain-containing protein [Ignavibacteria bacterium]
MKSKIVSIFIFALILFAVSKSSLAQDPMVVGPEIYKKVLLENDRVRVMDVVFAPGKSMPTHSHPAPHFVYVTAGGKLRITNQDGSSSEAELNVGDVLWMEPVTHSAVNYGDTEVKLIVVELKGKM